VVGVVEYLYPVAGTVAGVIPSVMAKLTRHPSFQALKSDAQPGRVPAAAREQAHAAFEEFVRQAQRARAKPRAADER
jgi:hypothetical protein